MTSGYLVAAFDLLNVGDLDLIEQAGRRCDRLVVGVLSDDLVEHLRGRRPVVPEVERVRLVAGIRGVHRVQLHDGWSDAPGTTVFVTEDDAHLAEDRQSVVLRPRRESGSAILRETLAPLAVLREALAMPAVA